MIIGYARISTTDQNLDLQKDALKKAVKSLNEKGIIFKSLQDNIDTSTPGGKLVFHIFCALAEFERDLVVERTRAGLDAARSRGRLGGRRFKLNEQQTKRLRQVYENKEISIPEMCKMFDISKQSLYNYLELTSG
jgi:DNA invertase Pin-like site-specific DNA recombinase